MGLFVLLAGILVIGIVVFDFLATTIGATSFSPVSKLVARGAFVILRRVPESHLKHRMAGVAVMTAIAIWWIIGHAAGWTLVFVGIGDAVITSETKLPASVTGIASHVGHLLSTVGGGVTQPSTAWWSLLGVLVGVNGMVVLTLSVSFVLSTTQTVARGRALLMKLDIVTLSDHGSDRRVLFELADLVAMLNAAPFALYYSAPEPDRRLPSGLTKLTSTWPPDRRQNLHKVLSELPWLALGNKEADLSDELKSWAKRFSASPDGDQSG